MRGNSNKSGVGEVRRDRFPTGLTLVELLVVVAIIALLLGLLLPAIHSARESARVVQCKANLRQVALGCTQHQEAQGSYPGTGGWYSHTGDFSEGVRGQRGGWLYGLLPYIEQGPLYSLDEGLSGTAKTAAQRKRIGTVVAAYACPTRGSPLVNRTFFGQNPIVRSDYAACNAGAGPGVFRVPGFTRDYEILDGFSNVFLVGERYLNPDHYYGGTGSMSTNDQGWTVGSDQDTMGRCSALSRLNFWKPTRDTPGLSCFVAGGYPISRNGIAFGGPHAFLHMAMCDGSVHGFTYDIDLGVYSRLGGMADGGVLDQAN